MLTKVKSWIAEWMIRRYLKRLKLSSAPLSQNQQIEALQAQIAALKAMQSANPNVSLADQLAALQQNSPSLPMTPSMVQQVMTNAAVPAPAVAPPATLEAAAPVAVPESAQALQQEPSPAPAPVVQETPAPLPSPQPEPDMTAPALPQATPVEAPTPAPAAKGSMLPDVKMWAPILKIAMATLSIEQMVEIGLHVKMGAPGFQQFLDSDIAKVKFRELYATYCEFLAGKVK
jgi:hypothetical protein